MGPKNCKRVCIISRMESDRKTRQEMAIEQMKLNPLIAVYTKMPKRKSSAGGIGVRCGADAPRRSNLFAGTSSRTPIPKDHPITSSQKFSMRTLTLYYSSRGLSVRQHLQIMTRCSGTTRAVCALLLPPGLQMRLRLLVLSSEREKERLRLYLVGAYDGKH